MILLLTHDNFFFISFGVVEHLFLPENRPLNKKKKLIVRKIAQITAKYNTMSTTIQLAQHQTRTIGRISFIE